MKSFVFSLLLSIPFFASSQTYDLTGYWQTENGGCYQIRQKGNEVWWATEQAFNIFHGYIAGNNLTGTWYDMPSNPAKAFAESISFRVENNSRLVKTAESAPYNGSVWTKMNAPCGSSSGSGSATTVSTGRWETVHEHNGCTNPDGYCRIWEFDMTFSPPSPQGNLEAQFGEYTLKGTLTGTAYSYQYFRYGTYHGKGQINFSPNFKSFTGTFQDLYGHRGPWEGKLE